MRAMRKEFAPAAARRRPVVYLIGALANKSVPSFANDLEAATGCEVFADWFTPGPEADDFLREYIAVRHPNGGIRAALNSYAARHVFEFDKSHIDRADAVVLLMPAGKSAHIELGYAVGCGKPAFVFFDGEPERVDVMYQFATGVALDIDTELAPMMRQYGLYHE